MSDKPLCGYCYNDCTDDCCDKRRIDVLERQLAEAREIVKETVNKNCSQCVHNYNNGDGWCGDCNEQLKEKG